MWINRALLVALCVVPLVCATCDISKSVVDQYNQYKQRNSEVTITLARQNWDSSKLTVKLASIILGEKAQFPLIQDGSIDACLEFWAGGNADVIEEFIETGKIETSFLGVIGQIGWYFPTTVLNIYYWATDWRSLSQDQLELLSDVFNHTLWDGPPDWGGYDADIIANNNYPFQIKRAASESALMQQVESGATILFYWWTPHALFEEVELTRVTLRDYSDACMALATSGGVYCDYPGDTIRKLFSPSLATTSPLAYSVLQNLTLTNDDQIFMLDLVVFHNISIDEAACLWLQNNYASWQSWIPDPSHSVSKLLILAISLPLGLFLIFGIGVGVVYFVHLKRKMRVSPINKIEIGEEKGKSFEAESVGYGPTEGRLLSRTSSILTQSGIFDDYSFMIQPNDLKICYPPLASGASGVVSKAYFKHTVVAVKTIIESSDLAEEVADAFVKEVTILKGLRHPNVILFIGATLNPPSIITELAENGSLCDLIRRSPAVLSSWSLRIKIAFNSATGMEYLHSLSPPLIHRDLKSANILLDRNYIAKIADFGISKTMLANAVSTKLVGTIRWSAPEVLRAQVDYSSKIDVFSFAVVMWELVTFKLPFWWLNFEHEVQDLVLSGKRLPLDASSCPPDFQELMVECWDENPDKRPDFEQVANRIAAMLSAPE